MPKQSSPAVDTCSLAEVVLWIEPFVARRGRRPDQDLMSQCIRLSRFSSFVISPALLTS